MRSDLHSVQLHSEISSSTYRNLIGKSVQQSLMWSMRIWLQSMQIDAHANRCTCQHMSINAPTMRWGINANAISYALYVAANGCASNVEEIRSVINTNELNCVIQMKNSCTIPANAFVVLSTCTQSLEKSSNTHSIQTTDNRQGAINHILGCAGSVSAICSAMHANAFSYTLKQIHSLVHSSKINKYCSRPTCNPLYGWSAIQNSEHVQSVKRREEVRAKRSTCVRSVIQSLQIRSVSHWIPMKSLQLQAELDSSQIHSMTQNGEKHSKK